MSTTSTTTEAQHLLRVLAAIRAAGWACIGVDYGDGREACFRKTDAQILEMAQAVDECRIEFQHAGMGAWADYGSVYVVWNGGTGEQAEEVICDYHTILEAAIAPTYTEPK